MRGAGTARRAGPPDLGSGGPFLFPCIVGALQTPCASRRHSPDENLTHPLIPGLCGADVARNTSGARAARTSSLRVPIPRRGLLDRGASSAGDQQVTGELVVMRAVAARRGGWPFCGHVAAVSQRRVHVPPPCRCDANLASSEAVTRSGESVWSGSGALRPPAASRRNDCGLQRPRRACPDSRGVRRRVEAHVASWRTSPTGPVASGLPSEAHRSCSRRIAGGGAPGGVIHGVVLATSGVSSVVAG